MEPLFLDTLSVTVLRYGHPCWIPNSGWFFALFFWIQQLQLVNNVAKFLNFSGVSAAFAPRTEVSAIGHFRRARAISSGILDF